MQAMIEALLHGYAEVCSVETADGTKTVRALLRPVGGTGAGEFTKVLSRLGEVPAERYLYIGPAAAMPKADGKITCHGQTYLVCSAQTIWARQEALYVWGLLRAYGGSGNAGNS